MPTCVVLIMEFRYDEVKIEESEKAGSRRVSNPGHLAYAASALPLSYDNWTTAQSCKSGTECLSHTPGNHSVRIVMVAGCLPAGLFTFL